jgi:hypothetical protein
MFRVKQIEQLLARRLDGKHGGRPRPVDPQRPPGAERGDPGADAVAAQASISTINGT